MLFSFATEKGGHRKKKTRPVFENLLFSDKALAALIFPLFLEQLLSVLVGLSDSIMVAQVSEAAVSAVSLVDSIAILLINIFNALATGGAVVAGQFLGARDHKRARYAGRQMMQFMVWLSAAVMILLYIGKPFILHVVFGKIAPDVMADSNTYLMISAASIPFLGIYCGGAALFRAMGNSKMSMYVSLIMNIINVSGNAILVFGFHRGVEGVAIPTLASRIVAAGLMIGFLWNEKHTLSLKGMHLFRFDGDMIRRILHIGIPNGIENSMFQLGKILLLSLISTFGTAAIAANAVSNSLAYFEILPGMSLGLATVTVISRCVGAGDYEQARYFSIRLMKFAYLSMWITCIVMMALLPFMMKVYSLSPKTSGYAEEIMILHSIMGMIFWPTAFTLPNVFRAANDVRFPMVVGVASMWLFRIVCAVIFGKFMGWGVFGTWVAMVLDWVVRAIFYGIHYIRGRWIGKTMIESKE